MLPFRNRTEAGQVLAREVSKAVQDESPIVLALPRGGVPVGYEVARALDSEFDVFVVRKIGAPGREELAIGAIASGNVQVLNLPLIKELHISRESIDRVTGRESEELTRRERIYRKGREPLGVSNRTVILVDDGLATGATMLAASRALSMRNPKRIVIAVPVGSKQACEELRAEGNDVICAATPDQFTAVGVWYEDFSQTTDREVEELLARAKHEGA
jgi:putative phosphoribosyl transferase